MLDTVKDWFGFGGKDAFQGHALGGHGHGHHGHDGGHGHTHGVVDPSIAATERGIWAVKWSFVILAVTAALQFIVVVASGSVALLADMIHNVGDATTAIPLWMAFALARRKPSKTFTYGLGRVEDLAGLAVVGIILLSALVAGYEAISRLIHPQPVIQLGWLAAAGVIGFLGNEGVAIFRIRVGREMNSAALIADGYHARTDGLTSLAVVLGALGVWLGFPLADPIIGLLITITIFGIVWQSARAVITRMLDGVDPAITDEIRHAAAHVEGIRAVTDTRTRWLGHELVGEVAIDIDPDASVADARRLAALLEAEARDHVPALTRLTVSLNKDGSERGGHHAHHHHAPDAFVVDTTTITGTLAIVDTAAGERIRLDTDRSCPDLVAFVSIARPDGPERLALRQVTDTRFESECAPAEPHEFEAELRLERGSNEIRVPFAMKEPVHVHGS